MWKPPSITMMAVLLCAPTVFGTLISDNFDSGINPGYLPVSGNTSITVETSGTGLTGNALLLSTTANNRTMDRSLGGSVTLANPGDYIEVSLDYRFTALLDDTFGFTVNLTSATAEGGMNFNPTGAANAGTYFTDTDSNSGRFDSIDSGTTAQSLTFRITRSSATEAILSSSFNSVARADSNVQTIGVGATLPGSAIGEPLSFDTLNLGWVSGNQGEVYFDNVVVTTNVIPEPGSFYLVGMGLVSLVSIKLMRHRR